MTVPTHFKFTFRGIFQDTPEIWSFGMHFQRAQPGEPDANVDDINTGDVTAALDALLGNSGSATFNPNVKATDWRAYRIDSDGKMAGDPLIVDVSGDTITGTGGTLFPPQIALVVTTVAADRGPAKFGRFYLPGPAAALASGLRLTDTVAGDYAEACTQFMKSISDAIDFPALTSAAGVNISDRPSGSGTLKNINHLEVGRVYDTLRTRRNQMVEERHVHGEIDW